MIGLDQRTIELMKEVFEGKTCCICGKNAVRMRQKKFFCLDHHTQSANSDSTKYHQMVYKLHYLEN
jgi:hypothetical protein